MKTKRKIKKKIAKKQNLNIPLFVVGLFGILLSVLAVTQSNRSVFDVRKRADEITPTPTNAPPTCLGLSVSPLSGKTPLELTLSCSGIDNDNDITAAEFGLGGDQKKTIEKNAGQYGTITLKAQYETAGSYIVTCRLRDNNNSWSTIPSNCENTVKVSPNITIISTQKIIPTALPITPTATLYPTATLTPTSDITPTIEAPTPIPTPVSSSMSKETIYTIGKIALISIVTIAVGLILKKLIDGNE